MPKCDFNHPKQTLTAMSSITTEEYNTFYGGYIALASGLPLLEGLSEGLDEIQAFFEDLPKEKQQYQYAEGKWTPKEILLHIIDTERIFSNRALQFARAAQVDLPGFDQDIYVKNSNANQRSLNSLLEEFLAVRTATILLFKSFGEGTLQRMGTASGYPLSVRAAGFIICGHAIHHLNILKERYL